MIESIGYLDEMVVHYTHTQIYNKIRVAILYAGLSLAWPRTRKYLPWLLTVLQGLQNLAPNIHILFMVRVSIFMITIQLS